MHFATDVKAVKQTKQIITHALFSQVKCVLWADDSAIFTNNKTIQ